MFKLFFFSRIRRFIFLTINFFLFTLKTRGLVEQKLFISDLHSGRRTISSKQIFTLIIKQNLILIFFYLIKTTKAVNPLSD